jgi:hypothetical protein
MNKLLKKYVNSKIIKLIHEYVFNINLTINGCNNPILVGNLTLNGHNRFKYGGQYTRSFKSRFFY